LPDERSKLGLVEGEVEDQGERLEALVPAAGEGVRLDSFLASCAGISRTSAKELILSGLVWVDGRGISKPSFRLREGQRVEALLPPAEGVVELKPEPVEFGLVYLDEHLIVVDKPAGLVVHPAPGNWSGTLANGLLYAFPELAGVGGEGRPGLVHRLDKETSGLMVVARSSIARRSLLEQFSRRSVEKGYLALVLGKPSPERGVIDAPVGRNPFDRKKMAVVFGGKEAITEYRVLRSFGEVSLVECRPKTGRTHQIRVHLSWMGFPILGDALYAKGRPPEWVRRLMLHAYLLVFRHPVWGSEMRFTSRLPGDFRDALRRVGWSQAT